MALYRYTAKTKQGRLTTGMVEAGSEEIAHDMVAERGLDLVGLSEVAAPSRFGLSMQIVGRIKSKDVVVLSRQLAVMTSANVPIVQALKILVDQTAHPRLKTIVSEIGDQIEGGARLSQAFGNYPDVFSDFFVSMLKAGETSGKIDEVLNFLADQAEKDYDLTSKVRGAMIYPMFIVGGLIVVATLMMIFVIPRITSILTESGAKLPLATRILIGTSSFMATYWWLLGLLGAALFVGIRMYIRTPVGRIQWDTLKIYLPIFGKIFRTIYLVRFSRSLSTLLVGGVPITRSLEVVSDVVGNAVYKELILETMRSVRDGNPLAMLFLESPLVPIAVSQMINIGEQSGKLDDVLTRLTGFYNREVEHQVANLTTLIEPIIMVVMGVGVALMISAIILPMYQLALSF